MNKINLGDEVIDKITGFKGIAIARSIWLTGCDRITVQPKGLNKEGKIYENQTFDEGTIELIKEKKHKRGNNKTGGPKPEIPKY